MSTIETRRHEIQSQMDEITQEVRRRMENVSPDMLGLLTTEYDWMTPEEKVKIHELRLKLPSFGE